MYFAKAEEMARLDGLAVEQGLEVRQMMELAGWHMLQLYKLAGISGSCEVAVVVGKGNKGGDGLSAARHLSNYGARVDIYLLDRKISPDAKRHLELLQIMGLRVVDYEGQILDDYEVVIDALIGYRLDGPPRGLFAEAVAKINQSSATTISYDLPTGLDVNSGEIPGEAVRADYTLMLALAKKAYTNPQASKFFGQTYLADIGIPNYIYDQIRVGSRPDFGSSGLFLVAD